MSGCYSTVSWVSSAADHAQFRVYRSAVTIQKADPDVIIGHEIVGVSLDVLLLRLRELKADHWSRIGRFRRSKWPAIGKQGTNLKFLNGRLLCDLASDGAKVRDSFDPALRPDAVFCRV